MLERGTGRIVNVSSVVGETGNIGQANYAASKSGLFGLTKTLAREAAYQLVTSGKSSPDGIGITVNAVTPGLISTEMTANIPEKVMAKMVGQIPVGRAGLPDEVARVVHFLAPTRPPTSPDRCGVSTAAWICDRAPAQRYRTASGVRRRQGAGPRGTGTCRYPRRRGGRRRGCADRTTAVCRISQRPHHLSGCRPGGKTRHSLAPPHGSRPDSESSDRRHRRGGR